MDCNEEWINRCRACCIVGENVVEVIKDRLTPLFIGHPRPVPSARLADVRAIEFRFKTTQDVDVAHAFLPRELAPAPAIGLLPGG